ncbi:MAG: caspase family protein [Thermoanaerobaculia bacterium]
MKSWKPLALGAVLLGVATATVVVPFALRGARSVRLLMDTPRNASTRFDRRQSAALFVGVHSFSGDSIDPVPFAVDDAVDLAYVFALERRVSLVPPRRVALVLSGQPVKDESKGRLRELRNAGADVSYRTGASDILEALHEQTALAGRDGLLIVSIASHGFLRDGNGYILGAKSVIRDPATMFSITDMLETIASSPAQRSLVFVDACRERMVKGRRAVVANAMSTAPPLVRRLGRTHGQAVFYAAAAGESAYDDFVARNGVFTKAVIGGVTCGAAKPGGLVTADTLASYVERSVHAWIRDNRDPNVGSATQSSIDGEARNMPLAQCWGAPPVPLRVTAGGSTIRAFSGKNEQLWQHDAGSVVTRFEAVDLDADGRSEVVFATHDALGVLDDNGKPLWSAREPMTLTSFVTCERFRQHTNEVVALWNGEHASCLAVYDAAGSRIGAFDDGRRIERVAIARPTKLSAPKIIATSGNLVLVFSAKKLAAGKPLWMGRISSNIASLEFVDADGDGKSDLALTPASGAKVFVDFNGHPIGSRSSARFKRLSAGSLR